MEHYDAIVIGGGLVGSAIAYGLVRARLRVALLDEGDVAFRASRGNFGLIWVQSKGDGAPHYQRWTRLSAQEWSALATELEAKTGIAVDYKRPGGVHLCLGEAEIEARHAWMERMRVQSGNFGFDYRIVDRRELTEMLPGLGPAVSSASWTPYGLMTGMPTRSTCFMRCTRVLPKTADENGGRYLPNSTVTEAGAAPGDFRIQLAGGEIGAPKVVLLPGSATPPWRGDSGSPPRSSR